MAEFALGLTKTAVEGTLSRVKSAIEEEGKQRERVQEDLIFITSEFEMMQAFLSASGAGEHASKNLVAWAWVRTGCLAFDVEDCVEFVVHLDEPSPWDWVQRLASSLPCLARPPLPLDEAVAEIKRLKARVEELSQRNTRYNIMAGGGDNGDENKEMIKRPAAGGHTHTSAPGAEAYHVLRDVWKAMGKLHEATGDLKRLIDSEGSELKVISLWGSPEADVVGELGWASIVKTAYDDAEISQQFKNRAWIKLSNPFNPAEFLNNLLAHFTSHRHDRHDDIAKLMIQVSQHKYLVILEEELSSVADWEAIKMCLPDCNNGSRIIVSTKHLGIARACTGEPFQVWELNRFSNDRYLCAIFPKGCGHRIGMAEFVWQLRRHPAVISLYVRNDEELDQFMCELKKAPHEVKFEHEYYHSQRNRMLDEDGEFDVAYLAGCILASSFPKDTRESLVKELKGMSHEGMIERCREFLTEHEWLVYIVGCLKSHEEWDLIRQELLCESTRASIVVITGNPSVAKHCVGHQQHLALNVEDLLNKGSSDQQHQSGHADGGRSITIKEEGESELVGRERESWFLFNDIYSSATVSPVWGIAGVGKSAIVREKYCYYKLYGGEDYIMYGWVDVAHPFSLTDMCRRLLLEFYSGDPDKQETAATGMVEGQDPIQMCCKILREKKCLLVIDDLRSSHEWDLIKSTLLSQANTGGRTIVITREESIAKHCASTKEHILNVKGLEANLALDLFKKISLDGKKPFEFTPNAEKISKLITSKCGGIPKVIVAIGKFAHANSMGNWLLEYINVHFMKMLDTPSSSSSLRGLFCWMQSYFDACSDELKPCIFYMSVFPQGQSIRRRRLLGRWIAEGYSSRGRGTAEEKVEELLSELMKLSILYQEQPTSSTTRSWKVNGFFLEYIKSRPMEDNLVFELQGSCGPGSWLTGQHLTISSSWDRDEIVFKSIDLSRLRSLTVFGKWVPFLISGDKMKMLRVLDLEDTSSALESDGTGAVTDDDLEMIGKLLTRLKFLSLRGCMEVTHLPDSLGAMRQLETLNVRHTSIVELPPAIITKLHKLRHIRAGTTEARRLQAATSTATTTITPPPSPQPPTTTTLEDIHSGTSPFLGAKAAALCVAQHASSRITGAWKRRAHALDEFSRSSNIWWESKKQLDRHRRRRVAANGGGVEVVPAAAGWIGTLTDLHTLGVLNVAGCGKRVFDALKKLTQLRKLGLSGVSRENWHDLCSAISGHGHLETLSLQLMLLEEGGSYDFAQFDDISMPPKTLKRLKVLYNTRRSAAAGCASIRPAFVNQLCNPDRFDHELTIARQEDIDILHADTSQVSSDHLRIKPIEQHLSFGKEGQDSGWFTVSDLMIECGSINSEVTFGGPIHISLTELKIHCCSSCGGSSCLRIVGLQHTPSVN